MKFETLPLDEKIQKGIRKAKFVTCTEVQKKALPGSLEGKDLMVQSKTGSGKTAVFVLAILHRYLEAKDQKPTALIIAPTRELAVQIALDAEVLSSGIEDYKVGCFYGGVGYNEQEKILTSKPNLIIGTPGRILDFQGSGKINFREIDIFVIDEADRLFDMGFFPDIQKMFGFMDKKRARQTMLFSATLTTRVRNLAWSYMNDPLIVEVEPEEITVKNVSQELYHISKDEKFSLLLRILNKENPKNALVFSNTKAMAIELSKRLNVNGYKSQYLMGDLAQNKRLAIINRMKRGALTFLVATDVAARGLQIDDLELVINYDIPEDYESYVHRIGRTARAGKSGKAISLACEQYVYGLEPIEKYIQMKIPVQWPDEKELPLVNDKSASMRFRDLVSQKEYASKRPPSGKREKKYAKSSFSAPRFTPAVKKSGPSVNYDHLKSLDFDQRLDYYKQLYGPKKKESKKREAVVKKEPKKLPFYKKFFKKRGKND